jgi:hypothetical protein
LLGLALNHDLPNLCLLSSWVYGVTDMYCQPFLYSPPFNTVS